MLHSFQFEKDPGINCKRAIFQRDAGSAPNMTRDAAGCILNLNSRDCIDAT